MSAQLLTGPLVPPSLSQTAQGEAQPFLSTLEVGLRERRLALAIVVVSGLMFVSVAPFAKTPLPALPAFLPLYQSALVVGELVTAVLLFGQFAILGSRALLLLAGAYLFSAGMAIAHALSFPGLFAPAGLFGAGPQTTAWLYFLWHGGFPLALIAYAFLAEKEPQAPRGRALAPVLKCVGIVLALVAGLYGLAAAGDNALPVLMQGNRDAPAKVAVATASWALSLVAIVALWRRRRPLAVLDLWLMVVLWVWVFDIALAAVLNAGRYDLGWYGGRVYGLLASVFVLVVLLLEYGRLYAELIAAREAERRLSQTVLAKQAERLRILHDIDRAILSEVEPEAIAGAVLQPLRELLGVPRVVVNMFDFRTGEVEWLAAAGRHQTRSGPGVRYPLVFMGDIERLRHGEPQIIDSASLPEGADKQALLASGVRHYMAVPMIAGGELIGAVSFGGETRDFPREQATIAQEAASQLAIAISQARLLAEVRRQSEELDRKVRERTAQLEAANQELESFSYSVSHDLRAPLRAIDGYGRMLEEDYAAALDGEGRRLLAVVRESSKQMARLIDDLLAFSQVGRRPMARKPIDMTELAREVAAGLAPEGAKARVLVGDLPAASGDRALLRQVWTNLIDNALKYSAKREQPVIQIGGRAQGPENVYWIRDNGSGFDMRYGNKLFGVFQRLHSAEEFEGTGVGLAIVQRVVKRHDGRVWAEGAVDEGACFSFSLPAGGPVDGKA